MRILALVHRVPYPPNKGEKIRAFHELRYLAGRGHAIDLATFADVEEDLGWREQLLEHCRDVVIVRKHRRLARARSVLAVPRSQPLSVGYFESFRLRRRVRAWLEERRYDVAFCYSSPMAEYVRNDVIHDRRLARVMDFVDVDSDKWNQYAEHTPQPMRALYRFEARALAAYEREISEEFDASTFVSEAEADMFREMAPRARRVLAIANGVDAGYFGATERRPRGAESPLIVFVGQMDYFANVDGVTYFAEEVMPLLRDRLPGAEFRIVGRAPTPEVLRLRDRAGVSVTGAVPDVRDHLAEATVMVAPLRIARGIQNKILEGMAARVPVVSSPEAMEGIRGEAGVHAVVCRDARAYCDEIVSLVADAPRRDRLVAAAHELVTSSYAWEPQMQRLEEVMLTCVDERMLSPA